jgi:adenosylmethionine-8-amino-7-oxononanoate aminotransferase
MPNDSHILHRQLRGRYPLAVRGEGCFIEDSEGRRYLDGSGGAAVSCLGHGHPDVLAAMHAQLDRIAYAHTSFFSTEVAEQLADVLVADAPDGISHAYLVSGGSEAMEAALKLRSASRSARSSSPAATVITATRSAHWPSAATNGGGGSSRRC